METVVILGAGQMGRAARNLLNMNNMELVAIGDNDSRKWDYDTEIQILPIAEALMTQPDCVLIGVIDEERAGQMERQTLALGYRGRVLTLSDVYTLFDVRGATFRRIADRVEATNVPGSIAELGTYRGDFAWQMNARFPKRTLYLFDTFEGFDARDIAAERRKSQSKAQTHDFGDTFEADVLARMPYEKSVVIRKGFFPETARGLESERYAAVSLDVDLYAPTLAGLQYFYPRLSEGGTIILHDYNSLRFDGVRRAAADYEQEYGRLDLIPLSDLHGTAIIVKPWNERKAGEAQ